MSAADFASRGRGLVAAHAPRDVDDREDLVWFAATVLHDIWLLPGLEVHAIGCDLDIDCTCGGE